VTECFFAHVSECEFRADGRPDRMHLIPAQRLRKAGLKRKQVQDARLIRPGCRKHHHQFDNGFIRLERVEIPQETEEAAAEYGVEWSLDRDYGEAT
jgi:hypothetical protein